MINDISYFYPTDRQAAHAPDPGAPSQERMVISGTLAFIGGGNMAASLISGLVAGGMAAKRIIVADRVPAQLESLRSRFGIRTTSSNETAAAEAGTILLAVKPQDLARAGAELRDVLAQRRPLLISIAAGVRTHTIQRWVGGLPVIRCMPNRPAMQGCGITGMYASHEIAAEQRMQAEQVLRAVGAVVWLERESELDAVTAISGSGPAYFFLMIESLQQAGRSLGLSEETSRKLAIETAYGAGMMARTTNQSAATLREQVTSKGGTTEAALRHLEARDFRGIMVQAVAEAARRSAQLADELDE